MRDAEQKRGTYGIKIMKMRLSSISGFDIQKEYFTIAQYNPQDFAVGLVAIQPVSLERPLRDWEIITDELKALKKTFTFSNRDIVSSVASEHAIVMNIGVEKDEEDIRDALEWELSQQIVGSVDEYAFDYFETNSKDQDDIRQYLVAAYRVDVVEDMVNALKSVKLNPVVVDIDVFALINVFVVNYRDVIDKPAILIHGESDRTKLVLTMNGMYVDFETYDSANESFDASSYIGQIETVAQKLLARNRTQTGPASLGSVSAYLCGSLFSRSEYLDTFLGRQSIQAELLDPFKKVGCHIGVEDEQLKNYAPRLAIAVGLALRGND